MIEKQKIIADSSACIAASTLLPAGMGSLTVLVGCEESQAVAIEFDKLGHYVNSCDLQDCSGGRPDLHIKDSIFHVLHKPPYSFGLDLFIAHPYCTFSANSSIRWLISKKEKEGYTWDGKIGRFVNKIRWEKMEEGALFFRSLWHTNCEKICLENPVIHKYALRIIGVRHSQIIQPWQFGHGEIKTTYLWLKGLPKLKPTNIVSGREQKCWKMPPSDDRAKLRSKTYPGIAAAMAMQWGGNACR